MGRYFCRLFCGVDREELCSLVSDYQLLLSVMERVPGEHRLSLWLNNKSVPTSDV